jgi:mono/diheme cytochrome c family protein
VVGGFVGAPTVGATVGAEPVVASGDPHATVADAIERATATAHGEGFTPVDGIGPRRWHTGAVRGADVRLLLGTGATFVLVTLAAACGADGPTTELERGEGIYAANCAQCHGGDLAGSDRGPSLLEPIYGPDRLTDAEFADAVRNGVEQRLWDFGDMPGNGSYSDAQIDAITAFVRSRQAAESAG